MSKRHKLMGFALVAVFVLVVVGSAAGAAADGKAVFESKCVTCHGKDGKGQTKAGKMLKTPDLIEETWKQGTSQSEVEKTLTEGLGKMKPYQGKLTPEEISAVAAYTIELAGLDKK